MATVCGRIPYGFRRVGHTATLVVNDDEVYAQARAQAFEAEGLSLAQISAKLASEGILARSGLPFKKQQVKILLGRRQDQSGRRRGRSSEGV
jgi:hypothetical protein